MGGLPELIGEDSCVPINDAASLASRLRLLWEEPERRRAEGEALLARAREAHSEERYTAALLDLYKRITIR
jgi:glycosyltransferase involved in cell wall biosynthesis